MGDVVGGKTNYSGAAGHVEIVTKIDPYTGEIISTGAGNKKVRNESFIQNVLEGEKWYGKLFSPFAVRR